MTQNEMSQEEKMENGYVELAADPEYQKEQERKFRTRGLGRRYRSERLPNEDEDGNTIPGMWGVEVTIGEQYESSHSYPIGLFPTLNDAQKYYDSYSEAITEGEKNERNNHTYSYCGINFIPLIASTPVLHNLYTIDTYRSEDGLSREIESVKSQILSEDKILALIEKGDDKALAAAWADRSLAVYADYCNVARRARVTEDEVIPASRFITLDLPTAYDPDDEKEYDDPYEVFISFDPQSVERLNP